MTIQEMFDKILLRSGQYIMNKNKVEINVDSFRLLVEDALAVYSKASPITRTYNQEIYYPRQFIFTPDYDPEMNRVPDWISKADPIRYGGGGSIGGILLQGVGTSLNGQNELIDPIQSPWRYDKPKLTVSHSAKYEILAVYDHVIEEIEDPNDPSKTIYTVKSITTKEQTFLKLLQGMFLQGIGRSRRAFTLNDLPITMDADSIVSEGKDLETEATESLENSQKFYLAYS